MTSSSPHPWLYAGLVASIPDITPISAKTKIHDPSKAPSEESPPPPPCRILQINADTPPTDLTPDDAQTTLSLAPQVLIFRYRGKIHAINHKCPHRDYPLSRGSLYDIEDFGIVLSAGILCPKHGWSFDLFTGESDRGGYRLGLWEVETRDGEDGAGEEVWVRRKS